MCTGNCLGFCVILTGDWLCLPNEDNGVYYMTPTEIQHLECKRVHLDEHVLCNEAAVVLA